MTSIASTTTPATAPATPAHRLAALLAEEREIVTEDVEFLADTGCQWAEVTARIGFCQDSIETHLRRAGRDDIPARIRRNSVRGLW